MNCHLNSLCHSVILINGDLGWVQLCQKSCISEFLNTHDVHSYLERDHDRALFGLPPIQPKPQQQPEHVQYSQEVQG